MTQQIINQFEVNNDDIYNYDNSPRNYYTPYLMIIKIFQKINFKNI